MSTKNDFKRLRSRAIVRKPMINHWLNPLQPILFYNSPPLFPPSPPTIKPKRKPNYQRSYVVLPQGGRHGLH